MTWPRRLTVGASSLTAMMVLAVALLTVAHATPEHVLVLLLAVVVAGVPAASGLATAHHQLDGWLGLLLVLPGLLAAITVLEEAVDWGGPTRPPGIAYLIAVSQGTWMLIYVVIALPLLFFPDGHVRSRSGRLLGAAIVGNTVVFMIVAATAPGPYLPPDELSPHVFGTMPAWLATLLVPACLALLLATLVAVAVRLVRRRRHSTGALRRQYSWLSVGAALVPLTLLGTWVSYAITGSANIVLLAGITATYVALPLVAAIAVVRPELYDPDRLLATTTLHMTVTAALLAVFSGVTAAAGLVLVRGAPEVAVAATALCALAIAPLRARVQRHVDRWLYPARQATSSAIDVLQREILSGAAQPEELEDRLCRALRDDTLRVLYRTPVAGTLVDEQGRATPLPSGVREVDICVGGQVTGVLWTRADLTLELLRDIAARAAPVAELVRMRVDLRGALREADESRARLLSVGYEERTRLERDLHDGAQQRLVALGMALRLAQRHLDRGVDVSAVMDMAVTELGTAVSELRQVAHGIRPSCLDDGLELALASLVSSAPLAISVNVEAPRLDKDVETTAYFVASEAIANAIKHSGAEHIALDVARRDGELHVRVSDDGTGMARLTDGSGLAGLRDRVAAQGGRLAVDSATLTGTVVEAVLPCGS